MSIQKILSPLLIISYVCGSRMIEFPANVPRQWFSFLYMLLLWFLYNFIFTRVVIPCTTHYGIFYHISFGISSFLAFLSIIIGIYYNKAFKNCIKNLTDVDDTLEKLGVTTDYKLYIRTIWFILGWFMIIVLIIRLEIPLLKNVNIIQTICIPFTEIYCVHINIISDLTLISMLWYVGLKFDQINEHLDKLTNNNKHRIKRNWRDSILLFEQSRHTKTSTNTYIIWIVIHLHLELRKISHKINLIFGTQMTMAMLCYFAYITLSIKQIFDMMFIKDYSSRINNKIHIITVFIVWLFLHIFRLFLINYECDKVSIKANATRYFISKLSYSNYDYEIRENILQFLLMTQLPFKFCGLGLFQFGFKFLQKVPTSIVTVLVIILQSYKN